MKLPPLPAELCCWGPINKPWPTKAVLLSQNPLRESDHQLIAATAKVNSLEEMELLFRAILEVRPQFASYTNEEKIKIVCQVKRALKQHLQTLDQLTQFTLDDWLGYASEVITAWKAFHQGLQLVV